ncbi:MAG: Tim44 domain-containing protein [Sneathiella sp.]|nr:Tim44 domain-containing protein [Sneathiella sp.]
MQFLDIIILVMVAAFIILRLRSVLGRRMGHEQQPREDQRNPTHNRRRIEEGDDDKDNVVPMNDSIDMAPARPRFEDLPLAMQTLWRMNELDHSVDPDRFASQAEMAYEAIVVGFANGDKNTLSDLLEKDVFESFEGAIDARADAGEEMTTDILSVLKSEVIDANLDGKDAEVTVHFETEMISMTKDADGVVVNGDPHPHIVREDWTFKRRLRSNNPNWLLSATRGSD